MSKRKHEVITVCPLCSKTFIYNKVYDIKVVGNFPLVKCPHCGEYVKVSDKQ